MPSGIWEFKGRREKECSLGPLERSPRLHSAISVLRCAGGRNPDSNYHTYRLSLNDPGFLAYHVVCRPHRQVGVYGEQNLSANNCFSSSYSHYLCNFFG